MKEDSILVQSLHAVRNHPRHALAGFLKRRLWESLGSVGHESHHGLTRRFELAKQAVLYVFPEWRSIFPSDQKPLDLLTIGDQLLSGSISLAEAKQAYDAGWLHADQISGELFEYRTDKLWVGFICYAACRALWVSFHDEPLLTIDDDEMSDPYLLDSAEYASATMAHGHVNDTHADHDARFAFWQWYLMDAFPRV